MIIGDVLYSAANWVIDLLIGLLPMSPFATLTAGSLVGEGMGWLNYFADIGGMIDLFTAWLACLALFITARAVVSVARDVGGFKQLYKSLFGGN